MSYQDHYRQRLTTALDAIDHVRNGDAIIVPTGVGEPPTLLAALSERRREFQDVLVS